MQIPSVGGSVTPGRFVVTALGAGLGITLASQYVLPSIPPSLTSWQIGPLTGALAFAGAGALLGGAAANIAFNALSK